MKRSGKGSGGSFIPHSGTSSRESEGGSSGVSASSSPSPASLQTTTAPVPPLRKGKVWAWQRAELAFAGAIVLEFRAGRLPGVTPGTALYDVLAQQLHSDKQRVKSKYKNTGNAQGSQFYEPRGHIYDEATLLQTAANFAHLREAFYDDVAAHKSQPMRLAEFISELLPPERLLRSAAAGATSSSADSAPRSTNAAALGAAVTQVEAVEEGEEGCCDSDDDSEEAAHYRRVAALWGCDVEDVRILAAALEAQDAT